MADKKFYWLKLKKDFFKRHDMKIIESMDNGKEYLLFYLKLMCESVDHDGSLRFSDTIPYNEKMLATITDTNVDIVRSAMKVFQELGLIEILDDQTIFLNEVQRILGSEGESAERVRRYRNSRQQQKELPLQCNTEVTNCNADVQNCNTEIEIDIEKEIEPEKEIEGEAASPLYPPPKPKNAKKVRHRYGIYGNVLLSDEDIEKLAKEFPADYSNRIDRLSEYMASTGKSYKNHLATIRNWARRDEEKKKKDTSDGGKWCAGNGNNSNDDWPY